MRNNNFNASFECTFLNESKHLINNVRVNMPFPTETRLDPQKFETHGLQAHTLVVVLWVQGGTRQDNQHSTHHFHFKNAMLHTTSMPMILFLDALCHKHHAILPFPFPCTSPSKPYIKFTSWHPRPHKRESNPIYSKSHQKAEAKSLFVWKLLCCELGHP